MQSSQLIERFNPFIAELFNDYFFDKYQFFFDRLISVNEVPPACYKETDDFILQLSDLLNNIPAATELFCSLNCDFMFDFYYRYHILIEYLHDVVKWPPCQDTDFKIEVTLDTSAGDLISLFFTTLHSCSLNLGDQIQATKC